MESGEDTILRLGDCGCMITLSLVLLQNGEVQVFDVINLVRELEVPLLNHLLDFIVCVDRYVGGGWYERISNKQS